MSDNTVVKDASNTNTTFDTEDIGAGVKRTRVRVAAVTAGASPDLGSTADAAVITDSNGSVISFLRGLVKLIAMIFPTSRGQKAKTGSLSVVLSNDDDLLTLLNGSHLLGGIKDDGPYYLVKQKFANSATPTHAFDITDNLIDTSKGIALDDLWISAESALVVTIQEDGGSTLYSFYLPAAQLTQLSPRNRLRGSANKKLQIVTDGDAQIYTWASWHEETPL